MDKRETLRKFVSEKICQWLEKIGLKDIPGQTAQDGCQYRCGEKTKEDLEKMGRKPKKASVVNEAVWGVQ